MHVVLEGIAALRADDHQPQAFHGVFQPGQLAEHYRAQFQQGLGFLGAHFRLHQLRNRLIHRVAEFRRHADVALPQHPRIRLINRRLPLLHPGVLLLLHPREILPQFVVLHPRVVKQLRRPARFILHPLANRLLLLSKRLLEFGAPCLCKLGFLRLQFFFKFRQQLFLYRLDFFLCPAGTGFLCFPIRFLHLPGSVLQRFILHLRHQLILLQARTKRIFLRCGAPPVPARLIKQAADRPQHTHAGCKRCAHGQFRVCRIRRQQLPRHRLAFGSEHIRHSVRGIRHRRIQYQHLIALRHRAVHQHGAFALMLLRQLCIQLIQQHGRPQVAQLNIQPGKQLLIIIPAILSAAARQLLHRILLKQRQCGQRFTAALVLIIIRRLLLFRPLIAVILRLFARLFLLLVYRLLRHGIAPSARCALAVAFCCFLVYHHPARIATLLDRGGFPLYNSHQCSLFYGEVIFHAACFFRCVCISRRIIGKNTQDTVRHGQARVSGGFSPTRCRFWRAFSSLASRMVC